MNKNKEIKIGDFGISKQLNLYKTHSLTLNKAGSNYYISPEILIKGIYNEKSDIWSLGCIIYELFTLNIYYNDKIMNDIKKVNSDIYNNKWQELINSLLQVDYNKRFDINQVIKYMEDKINVKINNKENNNKKYYIRKIPKLNKDVGRTILKILVMGNNGTNAIQYISGCSESIIDFSMKKFEYEGNIYIIQIRLYPDQTEFDSIKKAYIKHSDGLVIMSSAENIHTRNDCIKQKKYVDEFVIYPDGKELPCILVENNIDLLPNNQHFDPTFEEFWNNNGFNKGFRVSSKTGENVEASKEYLIIEIIKRIIIINEKIKAGEIDDIYHIEEEKKLFQKVR